MAYLPVVHVGRRRRTLQSASWLRRPEWRVTARRDDGRLVADCCKDSDQQRRVLPYVLARLRGHGCARFPIEVADRKAFMPAAGLPWFIAPFGRDALIVSLQNILIYPHFARGALEFLGSLQATDDDPYRDAEPGKILHELRCGELAHFRLVPHTP